MKNTFYIFSAVIILSACKMLGSKSNYEDAFYEATAQKFAMGARGGDRGVTFQVKFYNLGQELKSDTLWVNNIAMQTELTNVGDTSFVSAYYATQIEHQPPLVLDTAFTGALNVYMNDKRYKMKINSFKILAPLFYP
jgi:hypothetical protein